MASLSFRNETSSSFEVRVNDMSTSWGYKWIYWELFSPGLEEWFCIGDWTEYDIAEGEDTSDWLYVDGLDPDAEYEVRATITYSEAYWDDVVVDSVSTLPEEEILEWEFADRRDLGMRIDEYHSNITLSEAGVVRYEISFQIDGVAHFYTEGDTNTVGYVGPSYELDSETGEPIKWDYYDNNGGEGKNFDIEWVVTAFTTYYLWVRCRDIDVSGKTTVCIIPPVEEDFDESGAKLQVSSSDDGTIITAYVSGLDTSYSRDDRYIVWSLDGAPNEDTMAIAAKASKSEEVSWSWLIPGRTYTVGAVIWFTSNGEWGTKKLTENIITNSQRPAEFEWTNPKQKGYPVNLMAEEWKRLLENINDVREYKGLSIISEGIGERDFTYPSSKNYYLTAKMYNQCIYAMCEMEESGIDNPDDYLVFKGDKLTAAKLEFLRETINSIS